MHNPTMTPQRRRRLWFPGAILAVALGATACAAENGESAEDAAAEVITLTYATYVAESSSQAQGMREWVEAVNEESDTPVEVEFFYSEALLPATDILNGVGDGRADMGFVGAPYYPTELPLLQITGVPFLTDTYENQAQALTHLYEEEPIFAEELQSAGVELLTVSPLAPNIIIGNTPIESLDDLSGQTIRVTGYLEDAIAVAGGNVVGMSTPETYEAMQRGVLDMVTTFPFDAAVDFGMQEVGDHFVASGTGTSAATLNVINSDTWDSLPEDVQTAMISASRDDLDRQVEIIDQSNAEKCATLEDAGVAVETIPAEVIDLWQEELGETAIDAWRADAGQNAETFLDSYTSAVAEFDSDAASLSLCD